MATETSLEDTHFGSGDYSLRSKVSVSMGFPRKFRCFGRAKIKARAHSRLNFRAAKTSKFAQKPHGKACYAGYCDYFVIIELLRRTFIVDRARCKWTGRSAVKVFMENERFTVC